MRLSHLIELSKWRNILTDEPGYGQRHLLPIETVNNFIVFNSLNPSMNCLEFLNAILPEINSNLFPYWFSSLIHFHVKFDLVNWHFSSISILVQRTAKCHTAIRTHTRIEYMNWTAVSVSCRIYWSRHKNLHWTFNRTFLVWIDNYVDCIAIASILLVSVGKYNWNWLDLWSISAIISRSFFAADCLSIWFFVFKQTLRFTVSYSCMCARV